MLLAAPAPPTCFCSSGRIERRRCFLKSPRRSIIQHRCYPLCGSSEQIYKRVSETEQPPVFRPDSSPHFTKLTLSLHFLAEPLTEAVNQKGTIVAREALTKKYLAFYTRFPVLTEFSGRI